MGLADHEGTYQVDFPLNAVFETAQKQLKTLKGFAVAHVDPILRKIDVKAGMSLFSWGENITVTFKECGPSKTEIAILSAPMTGAILGDAADFGKNRQNIDKIMRVISEGLQQLPPPPPPPPSPRAVPVRKPAEFLFVCPHCGQHLECPPELEHVACSCPACGKDIVPAR